MLLLGTEPGLRWRTFCEQVHRRSCGPTDARLVVTLGALLSEVPHSRPVRVIGTAEDDDLIARLQLRRSTYEGPTGIVGVLHDALRRRGVPVAVAVGRGADLRVGPAVAGRRPRARASGSSSCSASRSTPAPSRRRPPTTSPASTSSSHDDDDLREFLDRLEAAYDEDAVDDADPADLIAEVERFLRDQ